MPAIKMVLSNKNSVSHRCKLLCLGPLTFHCQAVGNSVRLSHGCRLAERMGQTFKNGLVFSNRPVKVQERIRLRVEKDLLSWHGAMRVGFTNVPPSARSLPLPPMAMPNLTDRPGHWAAFPDESSCQVGSELEFWVSSGGTIYYKSNNVTHKLLSGVDLSLPLWAMIDIYGQTCSIFLLGSEKRGIFCTRKSCPVPECPTSPVVDKDDRTLPCVWSLGGGNKECTDINMEDPTGKGSEVDCVVCMTQQASVPLPCGHLCLCSLCAFRVLQEFGRCPLCRHEIRLKGSV